MKTNDIVYGVHAVTEALLTKHRKQTLPPRRFSEVRMLRKSKNWLQKEGIHFFGLQKKKSLSEMTEGAVHQGFVLRASEFTYSELDSILAKTRVKKKIHFY